MDQAVPTVRKSKIWLSAMRPRTLPLAVACIFMGSALAAADGAFNWAVAVLAFLTAIFLQILSNLANDYGDSQHGADHVERQGPRRAVQSGAVTAAQMRRAMALFVLLAGVSGLAMLWLAFGRGALDYIFLFVGLGAAAIIAAIAYTAGVRPYGYAGLGDLFVLIFFGWVGVIGSYFLHVQQFQWPLFLPATSTGLLAVAVLNVNNIRDIDSDRQAGKRSVPVRLGPRRARIYHWLLLTLAVLTALLYVLIDSRSPWQFLFLLAVPLLIRNGVAVWRTTAPAAINPLLKQLSLATLAFVFLFGTGQLL